jgi:hypothetical protein
LCQSPIDDFYGQNRGTFGRFWEMAGFFGGIDRQSENRLTFTVNVNGIRCFSLKFESSGL